MSGSTSLLYIGNIAISWGLLILIWLVQTIIYPGLSRIPSKDFVNYHRWYVTRISTIVLPLMICEVIATIGWLMLEPDSQYSTLAAFMLVIVWLSTFMLQVPIHRHLQSGKDLARIGRLVNTNWIRTIAWTVKSFIVTISAVNRI
ncbi:hypothetical protein D1AOALGA4SA_5517 [Olavius algarvensis Delta 1 endosymbiont]|nr:hypothetical protein D1AOALGA4SA_5517 [Olavius algarvensis Delta 1 endosymbiont]